MTKVTLAMPPEAAAKLLADPEAAKAYFRELGFDVEDIQLPTPTVERIQAYTWESPEGMTFTWNINEALRVIGDRVPVKEAELSLHSQIVALKSNGMRDHIDMDCAMTTDLNKPIIAVESPIEFTPGYITLLIVDGWHRIAGSVMKQNQTPLQVHVLTRDEETQCRIERME